MTTLTPNTNYTTDSAVNDPSFDEFDRAEYAKRVAHAIISRSDPSSSVVALYGVWGEGKTSVLQFIEHTIKENDSKVEYMRFNPWRFGSEDQILHDFFNTLAVKLGKTLKSVGERLTHNLLRIARHLPPIAINLDPNSGGNSGQINMDPAKAAENIQNSLELTIEEEKDRINKLLREAGKRIVVIMDDIDRLDKQEIQALFRLIKLTADFDLTTYLLAFDPNKVAEALSEQYGGSTKTSGLGFLEKIVQVPLALPRINPVLLKDYFYKCVAEAIRDSQVQVNESDFLEFQRGFSAGLEIRLTTPRMAKRFANTLSFTLPILEGEVYSSDLMLVEGMRIFYPELYEHIRRKFQTTYFVYKSPYSSLRGLIDYSSVVEPCLQDYSEDEKEAAIELLKFLFPEGTNPARDDEKRVSSVHYFDRYFSYAVWKGDVSDKLIDECINSTGSEQQLKIESVISELKTEAAARNFIYKLKQRLKTIESSTAKNLALSISNSGHKFCNATYNYCDAAELLCLLIERCDDHDRIETALNILRADSNESLGCHTLFMLQSSKHLNELNRAELKEAVENRIKDLLGFSCYYKAQPRKTGLLFETWAAWGGDVKSYTTSALKSNPKDCIGLLRAYFVGQPYSVVSDEYRHLSRFVVPEHIVEALKTICGEKFDVLATDQSAFSMDHHNLSDDEVVRRFFGMNERFSLKEQAKSNDGSQGSAPNN